MVKNMNSSRRLQQELARNHFRVAIFGSARITKGHPDYKLIYTLAQKIAREGMDIITGGGPGIMDAASKGHHDGREGNTTHAVGLQIKLPREQREAHHLDVKKEFSRFSERLDQFMRLSNIVVVAPGGIGTLLEFFYTWQLMQVKHICDTPIILLGKTWLPLLSWIRKVPLKRKLLDQEDLDLLFWVRTPEQVMSIIRKAHEQYRQGGKNICVNLKKYRW